MASTKVIIALSAFMLMSASIVLQANEVIEDRKYTLTETWDETPVLIEGYFSSNGNEDLDRVFSTDFKKCHDFNLSYINKKSEGYLVLKSFGNSDDKIVFEGVLGCMAAKDWKIDKMVSSQLVRARYNFYEFKEESLLTNDELKNSDKSIETQKQWYKKYAPEIYAH